MKITSLLAAMFIPSLIVKQGDSINPNNIISSAEITKILAITNNARRTVVPPSSYLANVDWNAPLASALDKYVVENGGEVFFQTDTEYPVTIPGVIYPWIGYNMMLRSEFANFKEECDFWVHDTNNNGQFRVADIFTYRFKQKNCFNYNHCNATKSTNFISCVDNPSTLVNTPSKQGSCDYFNWFYVPMIISNIKTVACASLGVPGPFTPNHQPNSFWCYACTPTPPVRPINDIPYKLR